MTVQVFETSPVEVHLSQFSEREGLCLSFQEELGKK